MPLISSYAQKKKIDYFFKDVPKDAKILEIGAADGWLGKYLKNNSWTNYTGLDLFPPADIVGSILDWKKLGIQENSYDIVVAFEVVEHVDCFKEVYDILKPGGLFFATSPVPHMDWACKILEFLKLNQKRTSPHDHLIYFKNIPYLAPVEIKTKGFIAQWGKFQKDKGHKT